MVPVRGYADKRVAVLGLQGPGFAAARAFEAGGADVTVWDEDGPQRLHAHKAGLTVEDPTERDWGDLAALVVEDARLLTMEDPPRLIALAQAVGAPLLAARCVLAEAAARDAGVTLALVTGRHAAAAAETALFLLKETGLAAHDLLDPAIADGGWVFGALSATELALLPDIIEAEAFAALSGSSSDPAVERLADAVDAALIVSADSRSTARLMARRRGDHAAAISGRQVLGRGVYVAGGTVFDMLDGRAVAAGRVPGLAPTEAVAAGFALARRLGAGFEAASAALNAWRGPNGQGREVLTLGQVRVIDWSAASTPAAALDAVSGRGPTVWIAGPALDPHAADLLAQAGGAPMAIHLVTDRRRAGRTLSKAAPCTVHRDLEAALAHAVHDALRSGDAPCAVVYAPGSVSGDTGEALDRAASHLLARARQGDAA